MTSQPGFQAPRRRLASLLTAMAVWVVVGVFTSGSSSAATAGSDPVGVWPLTPEPEVVDVFDPPDDPWGSGHRGVDLAGTSGQAVRSALPGVVTFAGTIAGKPVVTVSHGGTRTTYEPVIASVAVDATIAGGQVIGRLQVPFSHCFPSACLHWGLLEGETYLDPLSLVGGDDRVRLLPLWRDEPSGQEAAWSPVHLPVRFPPLPLPYAAWLALSGAWMGLPVGLTEPVGGDVRVELRGRQGGVPQQLLHGAQVGSPLEQVGRRGVP